MTNYHIIKIKYLPATTYRPARIKLISERFHNYVIIPYDYQYNSAYDMAEVWLLSHSFNVIGLAEGSDCYYIITDTFKPLKHKGEKIIMRAKQMKKNYLIIFDDEGNSYCQSYDDIVAKKTPDGAIYLDKKYYNYSATTRRHLYDFLNIHDKAGLDTLKPIFTNLNKD